MADSDIRALVFDWGGVIASESLWNWLRKNVPGLAEREEYFQRVIDRENEGLTTQGDMLSIFASEVGKSAQTISAELTNQRTLNQELIARMREWKPAYKIALLSNASGFLRKVLDERGLSDIFDATLISAEHRMIKPNPAIYMKMLDMLSLPAEACIFVDDRPINVEAANRVGMKGVLFTENATLWEDLKRFGVV